MAHRENIANQETKEYIGGWESVNFFYNISSAVGYGCRNNPNDVRLVQFFLNCYTKDYPGIRLVVDGDFGGQTWASIKSFQKDHGFNGFGTVSSPDGRRWYSPKTNFPYTIYALNAHFHNYYNDCWADPRRHAEFPRELAGHLFGPLPDLV